MSRNKKAGPRAGFLLRAETGYFLVSVVVVVALPVEGAVTVDLVVSVVLVPDGVVAVVVLIAVVVSVVGVVVVVVLLAVGAAAGVTSTLVVVEGAGVTSVLVQPITPKAMSAARIKGDFIVRVPSTGVVVRFAALAAPGDAVPLMHCNGSGSPGRFARAELYGIRCAASKSQGRR
jgi:hypothetical protein